MTRRVNMKEFSDTSKLTESGWNFLRFIAPSFLIDNALTKDEGNT